MVVGAADPSFQPSRTSRLRAQQQALPVTGRSSCESVESRGLDVVQLRHPPPGVTTRKERSQSSVLYDDDVVLTVRDDVAEPRGQHRGSRSAGKALRRSYRAGKSQVEQSTAGGAAG